MAAAALGRIAIPGADRAEAGQSRTSPDEERDAARTEPIVVHVRDASAGSIEIFRGTSVVELSDRDLAARIVRASK